MDDLIQKRLLTYKQAATILGVCERTVFNYVASGDLTSVKLGRLRRIDPHDLADFIEAGKEVKS